MWINLPIVRTVILEALWEKDALMKRWTKFVALLRGLYIWNKNNHSPRVTEEAEVYTKRQDFSTFTHRDRNVHFGSCRTIRVRYFVVFQTQNSGAVKLKVSSDDFDMLREGEKGMLTFQGTRFLGFKK